MENQEFTIFEVRIPAAVAPLLRYAAMADGWQPTITDESGQQVENPESAAERLFANTVRQATALAINALAAERANQARQAAIQEMTALSQQWLAAMTTGGNNG